VAPLLRGVRDSSLAGLERVGLLGPAFRAFERMKSLGQLRDDTPPDEPPLPPAHLRVRVAGTADASWFRTSGLLTANAVEDALVRHGLPLERAGRMLDFGCGCGRVLRNWDSAPGCVIHGCDPDPSLVRWCIQHLPFAECREQRSSPPLPYEDGVFGALYAISVFTHLPEAEQRDWLAEIHRAVRPAGLVILTVHGESYVDRLNPAERERFESGEIVVRWPSVAGSNLCTAFHPPASIRNRLSQGFELLEHSASAVPGTPTQDLVVLRRPSSADQRPASRTGPAAPAEG
jgi:SAM-dependent methyltransferase